MENVGSDRGKPHVLADPYPRTGAAHGLLGKTYLQPLSQRHNPVEPGPTALLPHRLTQLFWSMNDKGRETEKQKNRRKWEKKKMEIKKNANLRFGFFLSLRM